MPQGAVEQGGSCGVVLRQGKRPGLCIPMLTSHWLQAVSEK